MSNTEQQQEDDVLRRMLSTPPKPHKPVKESSPAREKTGKPKTSRANAGSSEA